MILRIFPFFYDKSISFVMQFNSFKPYCEQFLIPVNTAVVRTLLVVFKSIGKSTCICSESDIV